MGAPTFYLPSVLDIEPARIRARGFESVLLDLDNTLLPRGDDNIPADIRAWCDSLAEHDIRACLVSNNWQGRIQQVAGDLGFELVSKAIKPLPPAFLLGLRRLGATRRKTLMIGDQLFTDVLGATLLGIPTAMVLPLAAHDLPHTLMLRRVERLYIRGRQPVDQF